MPNEHESQVFSENFNLLKCLVNKMFSWHNDKDNLIGVGSESLLKAIRKFDPDRGVPFWGFAKLVVLRDIRRFINNEEKMEHYIDDNILASRNAGL